MEAFINWRIQATDSIIELQRLQKKKEELSECNFYMTLQKETYTKILKKEGDNEIEKELKEKLENIFKRGNGEERSEEKEEITTPNIDKNEINEQINNLRKEFQILAEKYKQEGKAVVHTILDENIARNKDVLEKKMEQKNEKEMKQTIENLPIFCNYNTYITYSIGNQITKNSMISKKIMATEEATEGEIKKLQHLLNIENKSRMLLNELLKMSKYMIENGFWCEDVVIYEPCEFEFFNIDYTII